MKLSNISFERPYGLTHTFTMLFIQQLMVSNVADEMLFDFWIYIYIHSFIVESNFRVIYLPRALIPKMSDYFIVLRFTVAMYYENAVSMYWHIFILLFHLSMLLKLQVAIHNTIINAMTQPKKTIAQQITSPINQNERKKKFRWFVFNNMQSCRRNGKLENNSLIFVVYSECKLWLCICAFVLLKQL